MMVVNHCLCQLFSTLLENVVPLGLEALCGVHDFQGDIGTSSPRKAVFGNASAEEFTPYVCPRFLLENLAE